LPFQEYVFFRCIEVLFLMFYPALINWAGGLYGGILTEVVSTERMQWGLHTPQRPRFSHTDQLSSVFIIWQTITFLVFHMINILLTELSLFVLFFSHQAFWHFHKYILLEENSLFLHFSLQLFFTTKHYRSRWENLAHFQYQFQPIKFMNSVVPSPCETQPHNNTGYY